MAYVILLECDVRYMSRVLLGLSMISASPLLSLVTDGSLGKVQEA